MAHFRYCTVSRTVVRNVIRPVLVRRRRVVAVRVPVKTMSSRLRKKCSRNMFMVAMVMVMEKEQQDEDTQTGRQTEREKEMDITRTPVPTHRS